MKRREVRGLCCREDEEGREKDACVCLIRTRAGDAWAAKWAPGSGLSRGEPNWKEQNREAYMWSSASCSSSAPLRAPTCASDHQTSVFPSSVDRHVALKVGTLGDVLVTERDVCAHTIPASASSASCAQTLRRANH